MARKPIHLQAAALSTPRARIWAAVRRAKTFTVAQIEAAINCERVGSARIETDTVRTYLRGLLSAGYVERIRPAISGRRADGGYGAAEYRLARDAGVCPPRVDGRGRPVTQGEAQQHLWQAMRRLRTFDYREAFIAASTDTVPIKPAAAKSYVMHLAHAGYLVVVAPSRPGTPARWRLPDARYTGPQAPQVQRTKRVWDPNTGELRDERLLGVSTLDQLLREGA